MRANPPVPRQEKKNLEERVVLVLALWFMFVVVCKMDVPAHECERVPSHDVAKLRHADAVAAFTV